MKKIVITGDGEGIGLGLRNALSPIANVVGYDLRNGKNVALEPTYSEVIKECEDANVVILNAHTGEQHSMLAELYVTYKEKPIHCIVLGSMVTQYYSDKESVPKEFNFVKYYEDKAKLDHKVKVIHTNGQKPFRVTIVRPSWVETPLAKEYNGKKLPVTAVVNSIVDIINAPYHVTTLNLEEIE